MKKIKFLGKIKDSIGTFFKKLVIESQIEEDDSRENLVLELANSQMDVKDAALLVKAFEDSQKSGNGLMKKIIGSIKLTKSDQEDGDFRTDETIGNITKGVNTNGGYNINTSNVKSVKQEERDEK